MNGKGSPVNDPADLARLEKRLSLLLSAIAGMVDVIGFVSLGLFTAHVTGNLVVIAALLVRGGPPKMAQILAVPVFIVAVAAVWLIAKVSDRRGPALVRRLLLLGHSPSCWPRGQSPCVKRIAADLKHGCQEADHPDFTQELPRKLLPTGVKETQSRSRNKR